MLDVAGHGSYDCLVASQANRRIASAYQWPLNHGRMNTTSRTSKFPLSASDDKIAGASSSPHDQSAAIRTVQCTQSNAAATTDCVAVEAPLEIRIRYVWNGIEQIVNAAVTMRTPGHDESLALGFLYNEKIITSVADVESVDLCEGRPGAIRVTLVDGVVPGEAIHDRQFYSTSSCGVCGKGSSEQIWRSLPDEVVFPTSQHRISDRVLRSLPGISRPHQSTFEMTGGCHSSSLFTHEGELLALFEDVGRHNATDKLVGSFLLREFERPPCPVLLLSGRVSFELMQKSLNLGVEVVAAIGAPSSLAVEIAKRYDTTLIGFLREGSYNVYNRPDRIHT